MIYCTIGSSMLSGYNEKTSRARALEVLRACNDESGFYLRRRKVSAVKPSPARARALGSGTAAV